MNTIINACRYKVDSGAENRTSFGFQYRITDDKDTDRI